METVNDIIRDVRERAEIALRQDGDATVHHSAIGHMLREFAVRLDAAYKRDLQSMVDAGECDMRTAMAEIAKLRKTNEVLECARDLWFERAQELKKRCDELYNGGAK